jgi:hypothetical protein
MKQADHRLITKAIPFFETHLHSRLLSVRSIAQQSLLVIDLLFEALGKRKHALALDGSGSHQSRAIASSSASVEEDEVAETYGRLLRRIGAIVVSVAKSGTNSVITKASSVPLEIASPNVAGMGSQQSRISVEDSRAMGNSYSTATKVFNGVGNVPYDLNAAAL